MDLPHELKTDASTLGWGAIFQNSKTKTILKMQGRWTQKESLMPSTWRETRVSDLSLEKVLEQIKSVESILLVTDVQNLITKMAKKNINLKTI